MDSFGSTDPRKMPGHLLWNAVRVDYDTAVRADPDKQDYGVCPRHWYVDATFECEDCHALFTWTAAEQKVWFEDYFFWIDSRPRQCSKCRAQRRHLLALRKEYDATIAAARDHGTREQKGRIVEIVSELEKAVGPLPEKILDTKRLFQRQIAKRAEQSDPGDP